MALTMVTGLIGRWAGQESALLGLFGALLAQYYVFSLMRVFPGEKAAKLGLVYVLTFIGDLAILGGVILLVLWHFVR